MTKLSLSNRIYSRVVRIPINWQLRRFFSAIINTIRFRFKRNNCADCPLTSQLEESGHAILGKIGADDVSYLRSLIKENIDEESVNEAADGLNPGIYYVNEDKLVNDKRFREIINKSNIRSISDRYLQARSQIISCSAWLTLPTIHQKAVNAQIFHRDIDTLRWLKVFIYLNDVGPNNGPHVFVPKSHKNNLFKKFARLSEQDILRNKMKPKEIYGDQGTILAVDTYGIHRGKPVTENERVLVQITLGTLPVVYKNYPKISEIEQSNRDAWYYYL